MSRAIRAVRSARVLGACATLILGAGACGLFSDSPPNIDPCATLRGGRYQPQAVARGSLKIRYGDEIIRFDESFVNISRFGRVNINACQVFNGRTWRLLSNWSVGDVELFPAEIVYVNAVREDETRTGLNGYLNLCETPGCNKHYQVFDSFSAVGLHSPTSYAGGTNGSGKILRYDPWSGDFAAWVKFENYEHKQVELEADLKWTPPPDGELPSRLADDAGGAMDSGHP